MIRRGKVPFSTMRKNFIAEVKVSLKPGEILKEKASATTEDVARNLIVNRFQSKDKSVVVEIVSISEVK